MHHCTDAIWGAFYFVSVEGGGARVCMLEAQLCAEVCVCVTPLAE